MPVQHQDPRIGLRDLGIRGAPRVLKVENRVHGSHRKHPNVADVEVGPEQVAMLLVLVHFEERCWIKDWLRVTVQEEHLRACGRVSSRPGIRSSDAVAEPSWRLPKPLADAVAESCAGSYTDTSPNPGVCLGSWNPSTKGSISSALSHPAPLFPSCSSAALPYALRKATCASSSPCPPLALFLHAHF
jgi:hypothetical protein